MHVYNYFGAVVVKLFAAVGTVSEHVVPEWSEICARQYRLM